MKRWITLFAVFFLVISVLLTRTATEESKIMYMSFGCLPNISNVQKIPFSDGETLHDILLREYDIRGQYAVVGSHEGFYLESIECYKNAELYFVIDTMLPLRILDVEFQPSNGSYILITDMN